MGVAGVAQWQFSDDAEQELWDVLASNPALHPKKSPASDHTVCLF